MPRPNKYEKPTAAGLKLFLDSWTSRSDPYSLSEKRIENVEREVANIATAMKALLKIEIARLEAEEG